MTIFRFIEVNLVPLGIIAGCTLIWGATGMGVSILFVVGITVLR